MYLRNQFILILFYLILLYFVGASSSVCEAISVHFATAGCRLVLSGCNGNLLRDTADKCVESGAAVEKVSQHDDIDIVVVVSLVIEDSVTVDWELSFGVPQGSVLCPKIYCMHTKPVSDIIHGLFHHSYADDTQL